MQIKLLTTIIAIILQSCIWQSVFAMNITELQKKIEWRGFGPQFMLDKKLAILGFAANKDGSGKFSFVDQYQMGQDVMIDAKGYTYGKPYKVPALDEQKFNVMFGQKKFVLHEINRRNPIAVDYDYAGNVYRMTTMDINGNKQSKLLIRK